MEQTINEKMTTYLRVLLQPLANKTVPFTESDERRRGQLLLAMLLLLPLFVLGKVSVALASTEKFLSSSNLMILASVGMASILLVTFRRSPYYRLLVTALIVGAAVTILWVMAGSHDPMDFLMSCYLTITLLVASVMFSIRGLLLFALFQIAALFLLIIFFLPGVHVSQEFDHLISHILVSGVIVLIQLHQKLLERDWMARIAEHEDVLRSANADMEQRVMQRTQDWAQANAELIQQIAEREHAERRLAAERNLLRTLLDNLPDPVFAIDLECRYILANEAHAASLYHPVSPQELIGKAASDVFTPDTARHYDESETEIMRTGVAVMNVLQQERASDGSVRDFLTSKIPFRDASGQIIGMVGIGRDITERKQAEDRLTNERNLLRTLIDNLPGMVFILDRERRYLMTNRAHSEIISGEPPDSMVGKRVHDFLPAEIAERFDRLDRELMEKGQPLLSQEEFYVDRSGANRWMLTSKIPLFDTDGQVYGLVGISHDITERKHFEMALQQSNVDLEIRVAERTAELQQANQNLQQQIVERQQAELSEREQRLLAEALRDTASAINSTLELDKILDRILVSIEHVLPYDTASIMLLDDDIARVVHGRGFVERGLTMAEVLALRLPLESHANLRVMYEKGQSLIINDTFSHPDWLLVPATRWIRSNVAAPIRAEGRVIGFINLDSAQSGTFGESVAGKLQAFADQAGVAIRNANLFAEIRRYTVELESRVAERAAEVLRERAQLRAILDSMHEGVIGNIDDDHPVHYINQGLLSMLGYTSDEWQANLLRPSGMSDEDYDALIAKTTHALNTEGVYRSEGRVRRKDGSSFEAEFVTSRIDDSTGKRIGSVVIVRDISPEKALQESKSMFVANASHELRTPLTNILTRLYLMRRQPERLQEHVDVLEGVSLRMRTLIEQLLDLSRYERGLIPIKPAEIDLRQVIQSVVHLQSQEAEKKGIVLQAVLPQEPLIIQADLERITQVLTNLVTNAINYTPESGRVRIEVELPTSERPQLRVHVIDTGVGIKPEQMVHLFQPFFRVSQQVKGTGLGLSIARQIMRQHGGDIEVQSEANAGSRFSMVFAPITN